MTGVELNKLRWVYRLLQSGRTNDAREQLEELMRAATETSPYLVALNLSLRGPTAPARPDLAVIERPVA